MAKWERFEEDCLQYLRREYGSSRIQKTGGVNAQYADIMVVKPNGSFFIESKCPSAQCGQFVLMPNEQARRFEYSPLNQTPRFQATEAIISAMDSDFDRFANAGTAGQEIGISPPAAFDWVKQYYATKGVKYFISRSEKTGGYAIAPLDRLDHYFSIAAIYREKKSGSRNPSAKHIPLLKDLLSANGVSANIQTAGGKTEVESPARLDKAKMPHDSGITFYFRATRVADTYRTTILSNTRNSNVIFSIQLIAEQDESDLQRFEREVNS